MRYPVCTSQKEGFSKEAENKFLTCSTLHDYNEFNSVSFEERPPALLVVMSVTEVPTRRVQQAEVVSWDQTELVTLTPMARMRG